MTFYGLKLIDIVVIIAYFAVVMIIGFWASRKVKNDEDFFLGGRRFGKGLLMMHWLCTGTHSEMAVQVAGATARVGLGGIWYVWMYLFSTPFYWLIAPIIRRLRVITTGDFFRIRYGRSLEMLYAIVAMLYLVQNMAMLLKGAGGAIEGATGGALATNTSVVLLSIMFSTYVIAGGLMAAAYTDYLQGVMIIVLSVLLVPVGLKVAGGAAALHDSLPPEMFSITAPAGAPEGSVMFVIAMSLLGLAGVVVQPHVMNATGSGKTEMEARIGMCYGNFIKRLLTMAWAFTGLIAVALFPHVLAGVEVGSTEAKEASETLFGLAIRELLGDGWRGLMLACIVAGVTSAETFMVVGAGVFTRNFYLHVAPDRSDQHYLWVSRIASASMLAISICVAFLAGSVTDLVLSAVKIIGLLGAAFWLGIVWRRANATAVWCSFLAATSLWLVVRIYPVPFKQLGNSGETILMLLVEFGVMFVVSLLTKPQSNKQLDPFFARLHTPVGCEQEMSLDHPSEDLPEAATLGLHDTPLDYRKAKSLAYPSLLRRGIEVPRLTVSDWGGFLLAWGIVGALIASLIWLARIGAS